MQRTSKMKKKISARFGMSNYDKSFYDKIVCQIMKKKIVRLNFFSTMICCLCVWFYRCCCLYENTRF
jgi:hypothetical protein